MSLSSYLASKYLTASPSSSSTSKKRKRKTAASESTGLIIADDDSLGWTNNNAEDQDADSGPLTISSGSAEFRKAKKNAWKVVGTPAPKDTDLDNESAAADAIIASAAAENSAAGHLDEEPAIEEDDGVVKMGDGTHAGLQSAAAVSAQMERRKREERARWDAEEAASGRKKGKKGEEETVYRDATGRRIDISMRRAEARKEADAAAAKERAEKEAQLGDVQIAAKAARREALEEARFMPMARTVDDEDMNRELKEKDRWNDPAAMFLTEKANKGKSVSGKPIYQGAAAPNRYGIRPGHRWDGVDRGNGWEGERFKAINRKTRNKELDFAWQTDT